jgi:aconitate hydratase
MLRKQGVVGKFVEFYGPGLANLTLPDRATIANMAPEYGATCGFFPVDKETLRYLAFTGRDAGRVALVEAYAKAQGLWAGDSAEPVFTSALELDLASVEPSLAGPRRPQDRVKLSEAGRSFVQTLAGALGANGSGAATVMAEEGGQAPPQERAAPVEGANYELKDGAVVIAAITSCTNTSNPSVLVGAGLLAKNAVKRGLHAKPWVKTSLAPGSQVVTDYLAAAGLNTYLDKLGFNLVGYGCTTCIGNSGPLDPAIAAAVERGKLVVAAVLSGNRNFEGRINPYVRANYLASPPLVVAYALAGTMAIDLTRDPLGEDDKGKPVYLRDIWPSNVEIQKAIESTLTPEMFRKRYSNVFLGDAMWQAVETSTGVAYGWDADSTYVKRPPFFDDLGGAPAAVSDIKGARLLALLGDSVTTDHISPAGSIKKDSPAGKYLIERGVSPADFNSYGARRGNHEVMMRGTFANIRLRNEMAPGTEGGMTRFMPGGETMTIFDAAMKYEKANVPLIVVAGTEYGTGSSRDWAAKGTRLLGVRAVIAESFERIHRSNLIGMGVLPLEFEKGVTRKTLGLDGSEVFDLTGIAGGVKPGMTVACKFTRTDGSARSVNLRCRIDTLDEAEYFRHGGILQYVLRNLMAA